MFNGIYTCKIMEMGRYLFMDSIAHHVTDLCMQSTKIPAGLDPEVCLVFGCPINIAAHHFTTSHPNSKYQHACNEENKRREEQPTRQETGAFSVNRRRHRPNRHGTRPISVGTSQTCSGSCRNHGPDRHWQCPLSSFWHHPFP